MSNKPVLFTNQGTTLGADLSALSLSIQLAAGKGASVATFDNGNFGFLTLTYPGAVELETRKETIKIGPKTSADVFPILQRDVENVNNGVGFSWSTGAKAECRLTPAVIAALNGSSGYSREGNTAIIGIDGRPGVTDNRVRQTYRAVYETQAVANHVRVGGSNGYNLFPDPDNGIAFSSLAITTPGAYATPPSITATASSGSGFAAVAVLTAGAITGWAISNKGSGYPASGVTFNLVGGSPTTPGAITGSINYTIAGLTFTSCTVRTARSFEEAMLNPGDLLNHGCSAPVSVAMPVVAISAAGRRNDTFAPGVDIVPMSRTDGGEGSVIIIDMYISNADMICCTGNGASDDYTNWAVEPNGRRKGFQVFTGNAIADPTIATDKTLKNVIMCPRLEYTSDYTQIRGWGVGTDSEGAGRVKGLVGYSFAHWAIIQAQKITGIKHELDNRSWSGTNSGGFVGIMKDQISPAAYNSLSSQVFLGTYYAGIIDVIGTVNDYTMTANSVLAAMNDAEIGKNSGGLAQRLRLYQNYSMIAVLGTIAPVDVTVKDMQGNSAIWDAYNAKFLASTYKGRSRVMDTGGAMNGVRSANGQMEYKHDGPLNIDVVTGGTSGVYTNGTTTVTIPAPPAGANARQAVGRVLCWDGKVQMIWMDDHGDGYAASATVGGTPTVTVTITSTNGATGATAVCQVGYTIDGIHRQMSAVKVSGDKLAPAVAYPQ